MNKTKATGASKAPGRAEPCPHVALAGAAGGAFTREPLARYGCAHCGHAGDYPAGAVALSCPKCGHALYLTDKRPGVAMKPRTHQQSRVIQPAGGQWPRPKCKAWTDEERAAAFEMRHGLGVPDSELATLVGVTRQALNAAIGERDSPFSGTWPARLKWRPSAELLARCGLPEVLQRGAAS